MKKFEVNKIYSMRSPCQHDCVWTYIVVSRTNCTVTLKERRGETVKCRISKKVSEYCDTEIVYPLGKYSMCPLLRA